MSAWASESLGDRQCRASDRLCRKMSWMQVVTAPAVGLREGGSLGKRRRMGVESW